MSKIEVDAIEPQSGTTLTIGASGDSVNIASGATITDFTSTGIDDNATSTAITIDSSEDVDIGATISSTGATSPQVTISSTGEQLLLQGTTNGIGQSVDILFEQKLTTDDTRAGGKISSVATGAYTAGSGDTYESALVFYSSDDNLNTERMRIDSGGSLNVAKANYANNVSATNAGWELLSNGNDPFIQHGNTGTGATTRYNFFNANGVVGSISTNGSATAYNTSSDYRLKENVNYDFDATTRLKQLKPARFNFIADADTTVDGFLAHEVQDIIPEAIHGIKDAVQVWKEGDELPEGVSVGDNKLDENGNTIPEYQGIDQSKLVPLLVKTIQELEARITTLENA